MSRKISLGVRRASSLLSTAASFVVPSAALAAPDLTALSSGTYFSLGLVTSALFCGGMGYVMHLRAVAEARCSDAENQLKAFNQHTIVSVTDRNARITEVNERFLETFGYSRDEVIGQQANAFYPDKEQHQFKLIRQAMNDGIPWTGELQLRAKSGRPIWTQTTVFPVYSEAGEHVSSISTRTDITAVKQMQSEQDMRAALHMLRDQVYVFDAETLHYTYMNKAAMDRSGWGDDYKDKTPADSVAEFDRGRFFERAKPLIKGRLPQLTYVIETDGTSFEINLQHIINVDGRAQFVAFANDISKRLAQEKAKDDFVSTVSHELRSPLTSIKGGLGLVLSGATGELSDKSRSLLEIAHRNSDRLVLIINDILDLQKFSSGQNQLNLAKTDLSVLIKDAAAANEAYCTQYQVGIRLVGTDEPHVVECDADKIFQILNNLMSNAAKFSIPGDDIVVSLATDGPDTLIAVRDYGVGIPAEAQATIFDRFTQVSGQDRKSKGGTGLGLNIVKVIAERHGGKVTLESAEGAGSTFVVRLPSRHSAQGRVQDAEILDAAQ